MATEIRTRGLWVGIAALAAAAMHGFLLWVYHFPDAKCFWGDEFMYLDAAERLASGSPDWHMELLWPPLYPQFLAGISVLSHGWNLIGVQLAQTALLLVSSILTASVTWRLTSSRAGAWVAGFLMFVLPEMAAFAHYLWPEILHVFFLSAVLWILSSRCDSKLWCAVAGACLGVAILTKSVLMPFAPLAMVAVVLIHPNARVLVRTVVFAVAAGLTILPTVIGNWQRTGLPIVADSATFNVLVGLNDRALRSFGDDVVEKTFREFMSSGEDLAERNRWARQRVRLTIRETGIPRLIMKQAARQYFRLFDKDSFLTAQLPGGPITKLGRGYLSRSEKVVVVTKIVSYASYAFVLLVAPLGFALQRSENTALMCLISAAVGYMLLLFLVVHVKSRSRVQILPIFFIGAGFAAAWCADVLEKSTIPRLQPLRVVAGACVSAALLFFAFAGACLD